ncbi:hypothetical protein BH10BAC6_BH10BAC6_02340 [soil metagenome]
MAVHPFLTLSDELLREKLASLFSMPGLGIAISTANKQFYDVNERFCEITGYTLEDLQSLTWTDITHAEDVEADINSFHRLTNEEIPGYTNDKRYVRKDGHVVWVELTVQTIRKPSGQIDYYIAFVQEISHRVKQLHNLREQNRQLEEFAQITSHNLRSPIGNLIGLIDLYKREADNSERDFLFAQIDTVTTTLLETINILARTLQIRDNVNLAREHLSFADVFDRVRATLLSNVVSPQTVIETDFSQCPEIDYPEIYLESIFLNLLTNALKYRSPDRQPHVVVRSWCDGDIPVLAMSDNGIGMNMERVGSKLFGLNKTFHRHPDARGIGLFLTKNMIEAMHGTISCESTEHVGTTFTIQFEDDE